MDVVEEVVVFSCIVEVEGSSLLNVLIINDDGINVLGLCVLVVVLIEDGSCYVFVCVLDL